MKYKQGIRFDNGKKVIVHAIASSDMPAFMGGYGLKVEDYPTIEDIISKIKEGADYKRLEINEIKQDDFNKLIRALKNQLVSLKFVSIYKEDNVTFDFKLLKLCKKLKYVDIHYHDRNVKLWNMRFNHKLEDVSVRGCARVLNQKGLEKASVKKLTIKRYTHGMPDANGLVIYDFNVFTTMPNLEELDLFIKKKQDKSEDLISLSKLTNIKKISLPKNYFYFNQYAWLSSKLPDVHGIGCYRVEYDHANEMDGYIINGSRMCWYVRGFEKAKLNRYVRKFNALVEQYKLDTVPPVK